MTDAAQLMGAIEADCTALDEAGKELSEVLDELSAAELAYGDAYDAELALLAEEYQDEGKRLPGEDVRHALIQKRIDPELYRAKRRLERRKEALEQWGRKAEKILSGRQSQLSFLKAEGQAPDQPSWSGRRAA